MKGHWYGPMPINTFFEEFLPLEEEEPASRPPFPPNDYFNAIPPAIPGDKDSEKELSKVFVSTVMTPTYATFDVMTGRARREISVPPRHGD